MNNWGQSLAPWKGASPGRAIVAGLLGSLVNTLAIRVAQMLPVPPGTGGFAKLVLAQTNQLLQRLGFALRAPANLSPVGQEVFHTLVGVVMALVYAWFFYRWLRGPGWVRGLIFCQIPWLVQVLVVLPWMGSGAFGLKLSTLTPVISFLLNALYGVVVGATYRPKAG